MNEGSRKALALLRSETGSRSGEALAEALGVSRAQIHNYVKTLREAGYEISGSAGEGYRLVKTPDRLLPDEIAHGLATRWWAHDYRHLDETDSTNRDAFQWADAGAPHGATVVAEAQTGGRGRRGRSFFSPKGLNLYSSTVLRPAMATEHLPTLMLSAGVAIANAIAEETDEPERVEIKWPNDVLVDGLKVSGVLPESKVDDAAVLFVVLGIGVNLNVLRGDLPEEFRDRATSLRSALGRSIDRVRFAQRLYLQLEGVIERHIAGGFGAVKGEYGELFRMVGKDVRVTDLDGTSVAGSVLGIAENGALRIRKGDGEEESFFAGDVSLRS